MDLLNNSELPSQMLMNSIEIMHFNKYYLEKLGRIYTIRDYVLERYIMDVGNFLNNHYDIYQVINSLKEKRM